MKTWFITGCSTGIGRGIAKAALASGDNVVLTARNIDKIKDFAEQYPDNAYCISLELNNDDDIINAVKSTIERFGTIDVLVNNAGYGYRSAVEESEMSQISKLFQVNFFAPFRLIQEVLPIMRTNGKGTIVNVTSIGGVRGAVGNGMYSAVKGAMELLSDTLYKECEPLGIRVLTVEPGAFRTAFYDSLQGTGNIIHDYADTAGKWHIENVENQRNQLGSSEKAGQVLVKVISGETLPKRLALGSDAVKIIRAEYQDRLSELEKWEQISIQTDYE